MEKLIFISLFFYYREPSTSGECLIGAVTQCDPESHPVNRCKWKSSNHAYVPDNTDGCLEDGYLFSQDFEENSLI